MNYRKIIKDYYCDINDLADLLSKMVNSYRLLIGGAGELNSIALAKKKDVRDSLKRANELGKVIDDIIKTLECSSCEYMNYCKLKAEIISYRMEYEYIETEIDEELKLKD